MNKSESIKEITAALAKAQVAFKPIKKTEKVDFTTKAGGRKKYNYAPLDEVIEATKAALSANSLAITQLTYVQGDSIVLETLLLHSSGEWLSSELYVGKKDQAPQDEGSALTYKRRYGMSAILGVASEEDDDAEGAMGRDPKPIVKLKVNTPQKQDETIEPDQITGDQYKKILALLTEKGIPPARVGTYIGIAFKKQKSQNLTQSEASQLFEDIEAGKLDKEVPIAESKLVKEIKKLGATEVKQKEV